MDHYLDILLRPDPEFSAPQLMSALFAKLHRALVWLRSDGIGISFPDAGQGTPTLGSRLRLHGSLEALQSLMNSEWLAGMRDHAECGPATAIPSIVAHRRVTRVQAKSSPERLRRRRMRRAKVSEDEARRLIPDTIVETLRLPFVEITSRSTGQKFRLFIAHGEPQQIPQAGTFNSYGLSDHATVPWF